MSKLNKKARNAGKQRVKLEWHLDNVHFFRTMSEWPYMNTLKNKNNQSSTPSKKCSSIMDAAKNRSSAMQQWLAGQGVIISCNSSPIRSVRGSPVNSPKWPSISSNANPGLQSEELKSPARKENLPFARKHCGKAPRPPR